MSPSRPFILRPVATTLLMVGVLLIGWVAFRQFADLRVTASRLPHDSGTNVLSGGQPGRDGFFGDGAAGAPSSARFPA